MNIKPRRALALFACVLALAGHAVVAAEPAPAAAPAKEQPAPSKPSEPSSDAGKKRDPAKPATPDPNVSRDVSHYNLEKSQPAAAGYDVVAYFGPAGDGKEGRAVKGDERFTSTFRGITYRFSSAKNMELFISAPIRFEPAYGGWCAYAMSDGKKVEIDPKSFLVSDGRLYLFYKDFFTDTRSKWVKKEMELNPRADKAWKKISGEDPPSDDDRACPLCLPKKK